MVFLFLPRPIMTIFNPYQNSISSERYNQMLSITKTLQSENESLREQSIALSAVLDNLRQADTVRAAQIQAVVPVSQPGQVLEEPTPDPLSDLLTNIQNVTSEILDPSATETDSVNYAKSLVVTTDERQLILNSSVQDNTTIIDLIDEIENLATLTVSLDIQDSLVTIRQYYMMINN